MRPSRCSSSTGLAGTFQLYLARQMKHPGATFAETLDATLSLGEFNLTWMLHTPLTKTLPVGLADSYASMRLEVASAYTLVFFVMIIPLLVAMQLFADRATRTGAPQVGA